MGNLVIQSKDSQTLKIHAHEHATASNQFGVCAQIWTYISCIHFNIHTSLPLRIILVHTRLSLFTYKIVIKYACSNHIHPFWPPSLPIQTHPFKCYILLNMLHDPSLHDQGFCQALLAFNKVKLIDCVHKLIRHCHCSTLKSAKISFFFLDSNTYWAL